MMTWHDDVAGHAAFKAMGCRVGYLYLNMAPTVYFGCMRGVGLLQRIVPIETGVGFLLWVGLQVRLLPSYHPTILPSYLLPSYHHPTGLYRRLCPNADSQR